MNPHPDSPRAVFKYLIRNERDARYGMTVNTVGYQEVAPNRSYPADGHPSGYCFAPDKGRVLREYQLLYIVRGQGFFTSDEQFRTRQSVGRGTLILLAPGQWHSYRPLPETGWNEYYIGFEGPMADNSLAELCIGTRRIFEIGLDNELVQLYNRAIEVATEDRPAAQQYLTGLVMHMIGLLLAKFRNGAPVTGNADQIVERAKILMHEHISDEIDLNALADELHISYSWFRKIFRDYTGHSPARYFQLLKLRRAQHLLTNSQFTIKQIAFTLGFKSTEHFFAVFKKHTGYTPATYRNSGRNMPQRS